VVLAGAWLARALARVWAEGPTLFGAALPAWTGPSLLAL